MAFRHTPVSIEFTDDEKLDRMRPFDWSPTPEAPDYPGGCCFSVAEADLEKIGCEGGEPGDTCDFAAMATVTHCMNGLKGSRIELEITELAGEDGKFVTLSAPASISLCDPELEKMDLDADCEVGDMIHLIGTMRLESVARSRGLPEIGLDGMETATLQIVALTYLEDESTESRGG